MVQKSGDQVTYAGMAGCLFIIIGLVVIACLMTWSRRSTLEPKLLFFIENSSKVSTEVCVSIDEDVIFQGQVLPTDRMPAIIFSKPLDLPGGRHDIRFDDKTRGITETKTFNTSSTRTIFVHMQKWMNDGYIEFYRELIYPK